MGAMSPNPPADIRPVSELKALVEAEQAGRPFLLYRDGDDNQRLFVFEPGSTSASVGRQRPADLLLDWDDQVSRLHARFEWVNDAWATGNTTAAAMMARGGTDWFFLTVNYALGQGIEAEATNYIEKHGGKVLGSARHPLGTSDFASLLLQAQNSKAGVIGLANAGGDTINAVKQAGEFGIQSGRA
jgi:ABC-type branched-subunit amino acid transport system substrate-binding protein